MSGAWTMDRLSATKRKMSVAEYVLAGLSNTPKSLPPLLLYDDRGSEIFEQITELGEYYLTRTERAILEQYADDLAAHCEQTVTLIEFGSGSSGKTEVLLRALIQGGHDTRYIPIDISEAALEEAADRLSTQLPDLEIHAVVAEYDSALERLQDYTTGQPVVLFLGSNLGNFDVHEQEIFFQSVRGAFELRNTRFLVGMDRAKDLNVLVRAYDDSDGVTAEFNMNLLRRFNRELGANFDLESFRHVAVWHDRASRVETYLESLKDQMVRFSAFDRSFSFYAGERIHTENSYKFTDERIVELGRLSGWRVDEEWRDDQDYFSLVMFAPT